MKTFKIYSLGNFYTSNTLFLTVIVMLYIPSPWVLYFVTRSLCFLTPFTHFIHSDPSPWQSPICSLYLWPCMSSEFFILIGGWLVGFRFHIYKKLYSTYLFLIDLFPPSIVPSIFASFGIVFLYIFLLLFFGVFFCCGFLKTLFSRVPQMIF